MIDLFIAVIITIAEPISSLFFTTSVYLILQFGVMLILGTCFMARQPLDDEKRFDKQGAPVSSWIWAMRGKKVLFASIFVLMFAFVIGGMGTLF